VVPQRSCISSISSWGLEHLVPARLLLLLLPRAGGRMRLLFLPGLRGA